MLLGTFQSVGPSPVLVVSKMSRPPIPGCPSEAKYNVPSSCTYGNISLSSVFILGPTFIGSLHVLPLLTKVTIHISLVFSSKAVSLSPYPPGLSDAKYIVLSPSANTG